MQQKKLTKKELKNSIRKLEKKPEAAGWIYRQNHRGFNLCV